MNRTPTPRNLRPSPPSVSAGRREGGLGRLRPTLRLSAVPAAWVFPPLVPASPLSHPVARLPLLAGGPTVPFSAGLFLAHFLALSCPHTLPAVFVLVSLPVPSAARAACCGPQLFPVPPSSPPPWGDPAEPPGLCLPSLPSLTPCPCPGPLAGSPIPLRPCLLPGLREEEFGVSTVVELNVGGQVFTTTTDTLRKLPGSRLAEVFSDPATACKDAEGRFFIDRPGTYFQPILDYLRSGQVPTQHIREVYREAQFYDIQPLVKLLEDTPEMFGEQVSRKQFLLQVPNYSEHLELLLRLARAEAVGRRESKVVVCVLCNEGQAAWCAEPICFLESQKMSVVKFGPCNLGYDNDDLLQCLEIDIKAQGYWVSYQEYRFEKAIKAKLENCFYTFTFTWW
ncbi:BTB/POZ domain-containing protein KCTD14 [Erethizon dorsatum]